MTLSEFKSLNALVQEYLIHDRGIELATRKGRGKHMKLYFIDSFYVEVSYLNGINCVASIRSFNTDAFLQPYLEQIDITELLH